MRSKCWSTFSSASSSVMKGRLTSSIVGDMCRGAGLSEAQSSSSVCTLCLACFTAASCSRTSSRRNRSTQRLMTNLNKRYRAVPFRSKQAAKTPSILPRVTTSMGGRAFSTSFIDREAMVFSFLSWYPPRRQRQHPKRHVSPSVWHHPQGNIPPRCFLVHVGGFYKRHISVPYGQPYCTRGDWEQPRHSTETAGEGKGKQVGGNADLVRESKKREIRAMLPCKSKSTRMPMHGMIPCWKRAEIHAISMLFSTFILGYSFKYEQHCKG